MHNNTDTKVINHSRTSGGAHRINYLPLYLALALLVIVVGFLAVGVVKKAIREKKAAAMDAAYIASFVEGDLIKPMPMPMPMPVPVPVPLKRKHVIFRLGDDEIFRFTYKDGGEDMRYSFEVREGGL